MNSYKEHINHDIFAGILEDDLNEAKSEWVGDTDQAIPPYEFYDMRE